MEKVERVELPGDQLGVFGGTVAPEGNGGLAGRFIVPPFSVLDAKQGYWRERKNQWLSLGIEGALGRGDNLGGPGQADEVVDKVEGLTWQATGFMADVITKRGGGSSIFDPVLCELMYSWFCPRGGHVFDPFAGESTKGIVATHLGFKYTGVELRVEQVDANYKQAVKMNLWPDWIMGDSEKIEELLPRKQQFDMVFTSPPYYDLEIYSESEKDGSAFETYDKFMAWYREIFRQSVAILKDNRFVVVKVAEIRDKKTGAQRNFVGDNIKCFMDLGLTYYNEAILLTAIGSLPVRTGRQFAAGLKLGKAHQNILIFYKGDMKKIKEVFGND